MDSFQIVVKLLTKGLRLQSDSASDCSRFFTGLFIKCVFTILTHKSILLVFADKKKDKMFRFTFTPLESVMQ
jgi:hypothetical protein